MIISKPKKNTLFALGMFIVLCLAAVIFSIRVLIKDTEPSWFYYFVVILLGPTVAGLIIKILWSYKIVKIGKQKFEVNFPFRFKKKKFSLGELTGWNEHIIKTPSGTFRELKIKSGKFAFKVSYQENTEYVKIHKYLIKKAAGKEFH